MGTYNIHESGHREAISSLAGGVIGVLVAGNSGGAIVGAFVSNLYSASTIKYEDKKIENGEEAARRLKPKFEKAEDNKEPEKKAEGAKEPEKKAEGAKEPEKKVEGAKEPEKKVEGAKEPEKKVAGLRGSQQKALKKQREEKVKLFIEEAQGLSQTMKAGSSAEAKVQYSVLAVEDIKEVTITEKRMLFMNNKHFELDTREIIREQGTYLSTIQFEVPYDVPRGYGILITTISNGRSLRTSKAFIHII